MLPEEKLIQIDDRNIVESLRERLTGLIAIYRFGSTANGTELRESDVDIAVLWDGRLSSGERWEIQTDMAVALRRDVDLVDLRLASAVLRIQVLIGGRLIYDGDSTSRAAFEGYCLSDYARLNEERSGILEDIIARGSVYAR